MLGLAKLRNLYRNYFLHYLYPSQQTSVGSGKGLLRFTTLQNVDRFVLSVAETYDGVICSGGFVNGHLRPEVCEEFLRVLKPGINFVKINHSFYNVGRLFATASACCKITVSYCLL